MAQQLASTGPMYNMICADSNGNISNSLVRTDELGNVEVARELEIKSTGPNALVVGGDIKGKSIKIDGNIELNGELRIGKWAIYSNSGDNVLQFRDRTQTTGDHRVAIFPGNFVDFRDRGIALKTWQIMPEVDPDKAMVFRRYGSGKRFAIYANNDSNVGE
jgi:hypothetical protein